MIVKFSFPSNKLLLKLNLFSVQLIRTNGKSMWYLIMKHDVSCHDLGWIMSSRDK